MEFSQIDLPSVIDHGQEALGVCETKYGKLCMVQVIVLTLVVWVWRADEQGVNRWILNYGFLLKKIAEAAQCSLDDYDEVKIVALSMAVSTCRLTTTR